MEQSNVFIENILGSVEGFLMFNIETDYGVFQFYPTVGSLSFDTQKNINTTHIKIFEKFYDLINQKNKHRDSSLSITAPVTVTYGQNHNRIIENFVDLK
jgi:hypothetical protein